MQAIEFKTTLKNGIVTIPAEYSSEWEGKAMAQGIRSSA